MFLKIIKLNILFILIFKISFAGIISDIKVDGNKRISSETIKIFSNVNIGQEYDNNKLNTVLKDLYETNFFDLVELRINKTTLLIKVVENPIIEDVEINGLRSKELTKTIRDLMELKSRKSYLESIAVSDLKRVKNLLRRNGYYFAIIESDILKNREQNTIRIVYDINLGKRAKIKSISFVGNKNVKDKNLRNIITSTEHKFWKFISRKVYVDEDRINLDKRLLLNYYKNNGYYNATINNSFLEIENDKTFKLIYNIDSGKKFRFNLFKLNIPKDYNASFFSELDKLFIDLKNRLYSLNEVEKLLNKIEKISINRNYEFIKVDLEEEIVANNKINFTINIKEGDKVFIERINIRGNFATKEEVIRNEFIVDEGDPFNNVLFNKSLNNLRNTGFFKSVDSKTVNGSTKDFKIIDLTVDEQATGEISVGAGVGTSGSTVSGGISENNFLGKGIRLDTNLSVSANSLTGKFVYSKPNFNYTDNTLFTSLTSTKTDNLTDYGYKTDKTGFSLGTTFEQFENLYFSPDIAISSESLTTNSTASKSLKKQEGSYSDLYFNYGLKYDLRNSRYNPTDGYITNFYQALPVVSDGSEFTNLFEINKYQKLFSGMVGQIGFYTKVVSSVGGKDVRASKRVSLPSKKLRGFEPGKIGPTDGKAFIGGNYSTAINMSTSLPQLFPSLQNVDFNYFVDIANVWGVDYSDANVKDSNSIRSATGIAVDILTPIGPLNFSLSQPISKSSSDITETFRFNLGTTF